MNLKNKKSSSLFFHDEPAKNMGCENISNGYWAGVQDIILYSNEKNIWNCIKTVLPSPSRIFAS